MTAASAQFLTFFVGDAQFAATASDVSEVFRRPKITRVPNGPASLLGIAGVRGAPTPVVSLAKLLGREDTATKSSRLLLLSGEQTIGLAVDGVGALAEMPVADAGASERQGFGRLYMVEDAALRVLDLEGLLRRDFSGLGAARPQKREVQDAGADAFETEAEIAMLGFELAGQAYALPLDEVREVIATPPGLAVIAQSDDAVLGVVEIRGQVLPIVSLRQLLGLPRADEASSHVVIARIGPASVGLAVDRLQAILRAPLSGIDAAPAVLNRGEGEAQVQSIARLAGGLVAMLSGERLFRDEKVAHILADGTDEESAVSDASDSATGEERFLVFRLGDEEYGLPLAAVDEVARLPDRLTRVPKAPAFVEGVLNLRGQVTPIIDQRGRFGAAAASGQARPRVIVTTVDGRPAGFIVDAVSEILELSEAEIEPTSTLTADAGRLFSRVATLDGGERLILLIEPKELLDRVERDLLAEMEALKAADGT